MAGDLFYTSNNMILKEIEEEIRRIIIRKYFKLSMEGLMNFDEMKEECYEIFRDKLAKINAIENEMNEQYNTLFKKMCPDDLEWYIFTVKNDQNSTSYIGPVNRNTFSWIREKDDFGISIYGIRYMLSLLNISDKPQLLDVNGFETEDSAQLFKELQ